MPDVFDGTSARPAERVATALPDGRVFTGIHGSVRAQAVAVGGDGRVLALDGNADPGRRIGSGTVVDAEVWGCRAVCPGA